MEHSMLGEADIPVVSLAALRDGDPRASESTARAFGSALEDIGFVTITDHGVPQADVATLYGLAKRFFALSVGQKLECMLPEKTKPYGYIPVGFESVAATLHGEEAPDLCEALVFRRPELDGRDGRANLWPAGMPTLKPAVLGYFKTLAGLARDLYRISEIALDLPSGYLAPYFKEPSLTLRLVNYPEQPRPPRVGQLRYGAHHDYGGLTILHQDDAPGGLQVCDKKGVWRDVPHRSGAFVINVGDLLSRWTNDRWRSTLHRVVNPPRDARGSTQRLSVVFFTGPDRAAEIGVLPSCVSETNPAKYAPVNAGEYPRAKIAASHDLRRS
jgi:isopenicillin N synthase-like dioxygenase